MGVCWAVKSGDGFVRPLIAWRKQKAPSHFCGEALNFGGYCAPVRILTFSYQYVKRYQSTPFAWNTPIRIKCASASAFS